MTVALIESRKEATQTRLTGNGFHTQHFLNRRIGAQMRYSRKLIRPLQNSSQKTQGRITRGIGIGTRGLMRQLLAQFLPKANLMQKTAPKNHPAMGGQPLVRKTNTQGLLPPLTADIYAHRLVSAFFTD